MFLLNYIQLSLWMTIYLCQKNKSRTIYRLIIKKIKDSGCIAIKFAQWMIPILEMEYNLDKDMLQEIEELYEDCNYEMDTYMENVYKQEFRKDFTKDFTNEGMIGSGSIGQVYKVKDRNNKLYALKILHPYSKFQITVCKYMINIFNFIPFTRRLLRYYIPIDIKTFIQDFELQTDLTNEANNCMRFYEIYKDNPKVVIPKIHKISKNILVMSYEEGETFDDSTISDYKKSKVITLLKCFIRDMEGYQHFVHGDVHKGNWKIRDQKGTDPSIVIYDFGFCWETSDSLNNVLPLLDIYLAKLVNADFSVREHLLKRVENVYKKDSENDILHEILYNFFQKTYTVEFISEDLKQSENINDVDDLVKYILTFSKRNNILLESCLFQCVIIINQMNKYVISADKEGHNHNVDDTLDIISYCQTHDIFKNYCDFLVDTLNRRQSTKQKQKSNFNFKELLQEFI